MFRMIIRTPRRRTIHQADPCSSPETRADDGVNIEALGIELLTDSTSNDADSNPPPDDIIATPDKHSDCDDATAAKAATDKETKRKEKMERDVKELKTLLEEKTYEIKQKAHSLKEGDEAVKRLEKLLHLCRLAGILEVVNMLGHIMTTSVLPLIVPTLKQSSGSIRLDRS
mgnify:CR=1 FL=1